MLVYWSRGLDFPNLRAWYKLKLFGFVWQCGCYWCVFNCFKYNELYERCDHFTLLETVKEHLCSSLVRPVSSHVSQLFVWCFVFSHLILIYLHMFVHGTGPSQAVCYERTAMIFINFRFCGTKIEKIFSRRNSKQSTSTNYHSPSSHNYPFQ